MPPVLKLVTSEAVPLAVSVTVPRETAVAPGVGTLEKVTVPVGVAPAYVDVTVAVSVT